MGDFKARDYVLYPVRILRWRNDFRAAERWDREKRRVEAQERLARTLHHAVTQVPYYRETYAPFRRRLESMVADLDLSPLPLLTKADVRSLGRALWADDHRRYRPTIGHTSGTTGSPMAFLLGGDSHAHHFAAIWNMLNWTGYRFGRRFADLHATPLPGGAWHWHDRRLNCLRLATHHLTCDTVAAYNQRLADFRPFLLKGTPSNLTIFARLLREQGVTPYQPPVILTCAETVYRHYRETLRGAFPASRIFDFYNQNERACLFSTCDEGAYHIHEDYSFVELVGDSPDHREVVTTTYFNAAMPLIRYRTNDLAEPGSGAPCPCGRTHRTVKGVLGRAMDVVVTPDGRFSTTFLYLFEDLPGIRFAQIYQEDVSRIEVRLVATSDFDRVTGLRRLKDGMRACLGPDIRIDFVFRDAIAAGANGKIKFIDSQPGRALIGLAPGGDGSSANAPPPPPVVAPQRGEGKVTHDAASSG